MASLAPALSTMPDLTSLRLDSNELRAAGAASLTPALAMMTQLTSLALSKNDIGAAGMASLAPALSRMTQLTSLALDENAMGAAGAVSLAPALSQVTKLVSLNLSRNNLEAAGAASLTPVLATMTQLTSLDLEHHYVLDYIEAAADLQPRPVSLAHLRSVLPLNLRVLGEDGEKIPFRILRTTLLKKLMDAYCARRNKDPDLMGFLFVGNLISPSNTALELEMEEDDEIDAMRLCGPSTAERALALARWGSW
jgi:hypothetical protein